MRRAAAFLRRYLPLMLAVLVLLTAVVAVWIFSAPIIQWLRSTQLSDVVTFLREHLLAVAIVGGGLLVLALIWLPKWQAARPGLTMQERFGLENDARKTLAEIVGGAALLVGLYFTWANLQVTQETATKDRETTREGQITERFTKVIEQLGNDKLQIRLGGIYALGWIARESPQDHWPIMEVLTAYVRENAPAPKDTPPPQDNRSPRRRAAPRKTSTTSKGAQSAEQGPPPKLATDFQAILTVPSRRVQAHEKEDQRLDLRGTDLHGADLWGAHLEEAELTGARLQGADLWDAQLQGTDPRGAQLKEARGLTVTQLSTVKTLYRSQLDLPLREQIQQQYPQLLEKPRARVSSNILAPVDPESRSRSS